MGVDRRPIHERSDRELVLQVLGTKGRPDPLMVELARRLEARMVDEELLPDVPALIRRQAG